MDLLRLTIEEERIQKLEEGTFLTTPECIATHLGVTRVTQMHHSFLFYLKLQPDDRNFLELGRLSFDC